MLVIGLTGSLGTGKSTVAMMLRELGAKVIDADKIVHRHLKRGGCCYCSVTRAFGDNIATKEGIDRKKLAAAVFSNPRLLKKLVGIIHPQVFRVIKNEVAALKDKGRTKVVVLDVPLLFESKFDYGVDVSIVVKTSQKVQVQRAVKRFSITKADALRRIKAQMPLTKKIRLADIIIDNNTTKIQTQGQVNEIWKRLLQKRKK